MKLKNTLLLICSIFSFFTISAQTYPDLRTLLNSQINSNVINLPKATYSLDLTSGGAYTFTSIKNVTINGNGSTIICNRQSQAFSFVNCENVHFSNLHIEYNPSCFTQGTITTMSTDKTNWDITIHDGYPVNNINLQGKVQAFGKNTLELVQNFQDIYNQTITKTGTNTFHVIVPIANNPVQVGDYAVLDVSATGSGVQGHGIVLTTCKNMLLDSIVMYDSNAFSFFETDCERTHYYRCVVTRKPYDPKYTIQPLRAGSADGIHCKFAKIGPIIEECRVEYNGDDCIAINGNFSPVYNMLDVTKRIYFLNQTANLSDFKMSVGDTIICVNNNGTIRGQAIVQSLMTTNPTGAQITACYSKLGNQAYSQWTNGVMVTVDNWIAGTAISDLFYSKNRSGSGFKVINNQVGHNRSRGILIKSSNGVITGNKVVGSAMCGIILTPEFYWMEAGCSSNIEISNDTILNCMYNSSQRGTTQAAALAILTSPPLGGFAAAGSLNNYSIHDNVIQGCPLPCVMLTSINGVNYYDNTITPDPSMNRTHGADVGVLNNVVLWMKNVTNFLTTPTAVENVSSAQKKNIIIDRSGNLLILGLNDEETVQIQVYDISGRMLISSTLSNNKGISTAFLKQGIYIVQAKSNLSQFTQKIIKP